MDAHQQRTRIELNPPAWLADGLRQLAALRHSSVNQLVIEAVQKQYPELTELQHSFLRRLLKRRESGGTVAGGVPGSPAVVDPAANTGQ